MAQRANYAPCMDVTIAHNFFLFAKRFDFIDNIYLFDLLQSYPQLCYKVEDEQPGRTTLTIIS